MTITTTGLNGTDCLPQYAISDDMVCTGRISGLDITDNGSTITISGGSAYVKVTDASGNEMNVKVYLDADETVTKSNNSDIIILVPLANVQNAQNNTDFTNIASLDVVPTGTGSDFHLVLATIDGSGIVSEINNAGHYLPGCDFCMKCEDGALQLPDINANNATFNDIDANDIDANDINANDINANDIDFSGVITGNGSGLTNVPLNAAYMTETTPGLGEIATASEVQSLDGDRVLTTGNIEWLFQVQPSWQVLQADYSPSSTNNIVSMEKLSGFDVKVGGVYRLGFLLGGDTGGGSARYEVRINGTPTAGVNIGGTTIASGVDILYNNGSYGDDGTYPNYFWTSTITTGSGWDKYYAEFGVAEGETIEVWGIDIGDTAVLDRVELMGTPYLFPSVQ